MTERYPFFREEDEQTLAVIGEEAADADLAGTYQKPYAILTQKRLYCKNERGNFITDASALRSTGTAPRPEQNWFLWAAAVCVLVIVFCAFNVRRSIYGYGVFIFTILNIILLVAALVALIILTNLRKTKPAAVVAWIAAALGLVFIWQSGVFNWWKYLFDSRISGYFIKELRLYTILLLVNAALCAVLGFFSLWWSRKRAMFQVVHATGTFSFAPEAYPKEELRNFAAQIDALRGW